MHSKSLSKVLLVAVLLMVLVTQGIPTNAVAEVLNIAAEGQTVQSDSQESGEQGTPGKQSDKSEQHEPKEQEQTPEPNGQAHDDQQGNQDQQDSQSAPSDQGNKGQDSKDDARQTPSNTSDKKDNKESSNSKSDDESKKNEKNDGQSEDESNSQRAFPAINTTRYANGLAVRINAAQGAFPANTAVRVQSADVEKFMADAGNLVEGEPVDARAVDICFIYDGNEIEPREGTSVLVDLQPITPVNGTSFAAVHVADNGSTEVVDSNATKEGASFEATEFSVYGIVGGSVVQGEDEQYMRLKVVFRNGSENGAVLSTQIVRAGDSLVAPDATSNEQGKVFQSWCVGDKEVDIKYLTSTLTEQDIDAMMSAYGATAVEDSTNLWQLNVVARYQAGCRAYFHWSPKGTAESTIIAGILSTSADGTVRLDDIWNVYSPSTDKSEVIGWVDAAGNDYELNATPTLTADTHFYPIYDGKWVDLEMNGAPALEDVFAQYDTAKKKYLLNFGDLPNAAVQDETFYPGHTFDGWYLTKDGETYTNKFESGTAELDVNQDKIYAKWNANTNVRYTIAYMIEDESGKPGEGSYILHARKTYTGMAGTTIPESVYSGETIDYHHYCTSDEEPYESNTTPTIIKGDGTTIKPVYYNCNRIRFICTSYANNGGYILNGASILPDTWAKSGESLNDWLGEPGSDAWNLYSQYVYALDEAGRQKGYIEEATNAQYSFAGRNTTIPYGDANKSTDKVEVTLVSKQDEILSRVNSQYYYEALPGEQITGAVTRYVDGQERQFALDPVRSNVWGSAASATSLAYERFGYSLENGGLIEKAYMCADDQEGGEGVLHQIDYTHAPFTNSPTTLNGGNGKPAAHRYGSEYSFDHYFVRARNNLSFYNLVSEDARYNKSDVMYGEPLQGYLPPYTEQTTCKIGGATYVFAGWFLDGNAAKNPDDPESDAVKLPDNAKMPASEMNIYASWRPITHAVTYDAQGGTIIDTEGGDQVNAGTYDVKVQSGKAIGMDDRPREVTCEGKVFGGWYLDQGLNTPLDYNTFTVRDNTTVYARWIDGKPCTVAYYDAEGRALEKPNNMFLQNTVVKLDGASEPTYNGQPFLGWGTKQGDVSSLVPNDFVIVDDVNLYAIYGNTTVAGGPTVTLHANYPNGTQDVTADPISVKPDTVNGEVTLPSYEGVAFMCPEGYRFVGWGVDAQGSGQIYAAGNPVGVHENTDLYAIWKKEPAPGQLIQVIKSATARSGLLARTGDPTNVLLWAGMLAMGGLAIGAGAYGRRRRER